MGTYSALAKTENCFFEDANRRSSSGGVRSRGANYRNQIWHDIELFNVQLALRRAGVVRSWQHEPEIRSQNDFTAYGYQKDYDAIVTFVWRDRSATVAAGV